MVIFLKYMFTSRKFGAAVDQMVKKVVIEHHTLFTCCFFFFFISMNCLRDPVSRS